MAPRQEDGSFGLKEAMAPKLKNRSLGLKEAQEYAAKALAKDIAIAALECWYRIGYKRANARIPSTQVESNLKVVAAIPGWQERKGRKNAYVMLTSLLDETPNPCIIELDYSNDGKPCGGVTCRQLHQQVRKHLRQLPVQSLMMISAKPWYRYGRTGSPFLDDRKIHDSDAQCTHLLGTTLLWWSDPDDDGIVCRRPGELPSWREHGHSLRWMWL